MDVITFLRDLSVSLLTEIVSTAIAVPLLTYVVVKLLQNARSARIWGVSTKLRQILQARPFPAIVLSTSGAFEMGNGYRRPMTGIGQVRALARFGKSLGAAYRSSIDDTRVVLSDEYEITRDEFSDDLVVIGGPKTNEIGNEFLNGEFRLGVLPKGFTFAPGLVTLPDGSTIKSFLLATNGTQWQPRHENEAIGMVLRCANPLSSVDRNLTYVAGLGTYGTETAAKALVECRRLHDPMPLSWRWWVSKVRRKSRRGYLAIVAAKLAGDGGSRRVGTPEILEVTELQWSAEAR